MHLCISELIKHSHLLLKLSVLFFVICTRSGIARQQCKTQR